VEGAGGPKPFVAPGPAGDKAADWDLYVITPAGKQVSMATESGSETLTIDDPAPGTYTVIGHLFSAPAGSDTASLETLQLREDAGNLTVTPNPVPVTTGKTTQATVSWSGLTEGTWRGRVLWADGAATDVAVTVP